MSGIGRCGWAYGMWLMWLLMDAGGLLAFWVTGSGCLLVGIPSRLQNG